MKRALPCHRLAEDWGETGGGKNWDGEAGNKAEAKARVVPVSFVSPSEKKRFSPNPTTACQKRNGNHRGRANREEIWDPYHSPDRAGSAADWGRVEDSGGEGMRGWMERDKDGPAAGISYRIPPFQGKREKRREEQSSSVERTDGGAPDRLRVNALVGPPGRGNFGRIGSGLVCFCFPGNVWGLCAWVGARIRTFEIRWRGERAIFWGEDPPARQRTGKDMTSWGRRPEGKILRFYSTRPRTSTTQPPETNNYASALGLGTRTCIQQRPPALI